MTNNKENNPPGDSPQRPAFIKPSVSWRSDSATQAVKALSGTKTKTKKRLHFDRKATSMLLDKLSTPDESCKESDAYKRSQSPRENFFLSKYDVNADVFEPLSQSPTKAIQQRQKDLSDIFGDGSRERRMVDGNAAMRDIDVLPATAAEHPAKKIKIEGEMGQDLVSELESLVQSTCNENDALNAIPTTKKATIADERDTVSNSPAAAKPLTVTPVRDKLDASLEDVPVELALFQDLEEDVSLSAEIHAAFEEQESEQREQRELQHTKTANGDGGLQADNKSIPTLATAKAKDDVLAMKQNCHRCLILEVQSSMATLQKRTFNQINLRVLLEDDDHKESMVLLRDDWCFMELAIGDYIHIIGDFNLEENAFVVDSQQGLVILHPDYLISSTMVADGFHCTRKAVLEDRVKRLNDSTEAMVHGQMLHQILQYGLDQGDFSEDGLNAQIDRTIRTSVQNLYTINQSEEVAREKLREWMPLLIDWSTKFVHHVPKPEAKVMLHRNETKQNTTAAIAEVLDIEEHVWSPQYGLKGMIDASVQISLREENLNVVQRTLTVPFEFKTGRSSSVMAHRAQTILYTLLMGDRYGVEVLSGLLYYLQSGDTILVPSVRDEIRGLILKRNEIASYVLNRQRLPPMIKNVHACQHCYVKDSCFVYHKAVEQGNGRTSGLGGLFDEHTSHITPTHSRFFAKWDSLITLEEGDMARYRREIWLMTSKERESAGNCFAEMNLLEQTKMDNPSAGVARFTYRFGKHQSMSVVSDDDHGVLKATSICVGDPVVISSEAGHYALAIGFVTDISESTVTVTGDRCIRGPPERSKNFSIESNQRFVPNKTGETLRIREKGTLFRIDKDEMSSGMTMIRNNLVTLMKREVDGGDAKRRRLIVELDVPKYDTIDHIDKLHGRGLNLDQKLAICKVLNAQDYTLILGMPGTGKTTTISELVIELVRNKKSVLLTSYTHSAVDNILLKLLPTDVRFLRLGNVEKIHSAVRPHTVNEANASSVHQLRELYENCDVVATTCLGITHPLFTMRRFDYCIVDEASQLTLPVCIGPLRYADKFVLVGDHYQLPPLVRNVDAREEGLSSSLFKILCEAHPNAITYLSHQYRMNADIMLLCNSLIYDHKMKCGTADVARKQLAIPDMKALDLIHQRTTTTLEACSKNGCWLKAVIDPRRRVIFLDTDRVPAYDTRVGELVRNEREAILLSQVVETLLACGVPESKIGVISVYRAQLPLISQQLNHRSNVEIHTIDRFQGRDKDCVVFSLVRSNKSGKIGDLLRDWRRLNVALTRAKSKLVIVGSKSTLQASQLFSHMLALLTSNHWILELPPHAHELHSFERPQPSSQTSMTPEIDTYARPKAFFKRVRTESSILRDIRNCLS